MANHSVVVIGASAGGVTALQDFASRLSSPIPAPILVVLHIGAQRSELPAPLNAAGPTPARHGEGGELIRAGHIYLAPPDRHMMVDGHLILLTRGPKENWARPAIDPLFRSAAFAYGSSAIGVVLTGNLNDGSAGLYEIKRHGGIAIVQEPESAAYPDMPQSAADQVDLDYCVSLADLPDLLTKLVIEKERVVSLQSRLCPKRLWESPVAIAARKDERDVAFHQDFGDWKDLTSAYGNVKDCCVELLLLGNPYGRLQLAHWPQDHAAEDLQDVLDQHRDHHLVLDDEDSSVC
jgi:hypothetical protein